MTETLLQITRIASKILV